MVLSTSSSEISSPEYLNEFGIAFSLAETPLDVFFLYFCVAPNTVRSWPIKHFHNPANKITVIYFQSFALTVKCPLNELSHIMRPKLCIHYPFQRRQGRNYIFIENKIMYSLRT